MKKKKVINAANRSYNIPTVATIAWYLLLDKFNIPEWAWGMFILIFAAFWIIAILDSIYSEELDELK